MRKAIGPAWPMGHTSHRYMPGTMAEGQVRGFPPVAPDPFCATCGMGKGHPVHESGTPEEGRDA